MNAHFLSHNGLGDNLYSIGALRFLLNYYEKIFFLCKDIYYENVKLFFLDTDRIICVPFDANNERRHCYNIISKFYNWNKNDIFICGEYHKSYLRSKITNPAVINIKNADTPSTYTIYYDMITAANYNFIENFYKDINLDFSIFFKYWELPMTEMSKTLYETVKQYKIIFLQTTSSNNYKLNITKLLDKYLYDEGSILISNDENLYNNRAGLPHMNEKQRICEQFVKNKIIYYLDTIINSSEIYIIDSCFVGIVLPLKKMNKLNASIVRIILRNKANNIIL
jgi:hypothetical protein